MKDRYGKSLKVGDKVLTVVTVYRSGQFRESIITEIVPWGNKEVAKVKGLQNHRSENELVKI